MKKVVSLTELKYMKMYKEYYSKQINRSFAVSCFFKSDVTVKTG